MQLSILEKAGTFPVRILLSREKGFRILVWRRVLCHTLAAPKNGFEPETWNKISRPKMKAWELAVAVHPRT